MIGGRATICPECSYHWTIVPAVPVSWSCPRCGGSITEKTEHRFCKCGHEYSQHRFAQEVRPSRAGFWIRGDQARDNVDLIVAALRAEPEPTPDVGKCTKCACQGYELRPFEMLSSIFMHEVHIASKRGSGGRGPDGRREIPVRQIDERTYVFTSGRRNVVLRNEDTDLIALYRGKSMPGSGKKPLKTFRIGQATIGKVVIAIRAVLSAPMRNGQHGSR